MKISLLKVFILWIISITLVAWGGPVYLGCGSNTATTEETVEEISDAEGDIFDDGPVGIPAPIARVEGSDQDNTDIVLSGDDSFEITGRAGAVPRPGTTPFVWVCNNNEDVTSSRTTACTEIEVASDGSFGSVTIISRFISIYTATGRLTDSGVMIGPPLTLKVNDDGVIVYVLTNLADGKGARYYAALKQDLNSNVCFVKQNDGGDSVCCVSPTGGLPTCTPTLSSETISYFTATTSAMIAITEANNVYRFNATDDDFEDPELIENYSLETACAEAVDASDINCESLAVDSGNRLQLISHEALGGIFCMVGRDNAFDDFWLRCCDEGNVCTTLEERQDDLEPFEMEFFTDSETGMTTVFNNRSSNQDGIGLIEQFDLDFGSDNPNLAVLQTLYGARTQTFTTTFALTNISAGKDRLSLTQEDASGAKTYFTLDLNNLSSGLTSLISIVGTPIVTHDLKSNVHPSGNFVCLCQDSDGNAADDNNIEVKLLECYSGSDFTALTTLNVGPQGCNVRTQSLEFGNRGNTYFHLFGGESTDNPAQVSLIKLGDTDLSSLLE